MRGIAIFCIFLNCFVWFMASITSLMHYLRGTIPPPQPPNLGLVIASLLLLLMNIVILIYFFRKKEDKVSPRREMDMKKVLLGFGWFVIIYIVVSFVTGAVVGGIAGSSAPTGSAMEAGRNAGANFGHKYGLWVFLGSALIAIIGTAKELLPFTKDKEK